MQALDMTATTENLQLPITAGSNEGEVTTYLAPPPAPPLPPSKAEVQPKATKEGEEQPQAPRGPRNGFQGKRRNSFHVGLKQPVPFKRRRRVNSDCDPVLPSNFLLGGNIFDPLNLNSLLDEEVNRTLNAETPKSSPLPSRNRDPVQILIPKDITDPLCLNANSGELLLSPLKSGRKRHRHRHHPSTDAPSKAPVGVAEEAEPAPEEPQPYELNTAINCRDEVVTLPVLENELVAPSVSSSSVSNSRHHKRRRTTSKSEGKAGSPERGKSLSAERSAPRPHSPKSQAKSKGRFLHGNYCRYYGYRNPCHSEDPRLRALKPEWFLGKSVLDIGCNVGHVTLYVAKNMGPSCVVGLDIDGTLINAARQNIRHYLSEESKKVGGFPAGLVATRGPIAAPLLQPKQGDDEKKVFPHNVLFVQGNYVLEREELVEMQQSEYDVILCLSVTKWVHLNSGDQGLKRMFRRIYRHLRPGGTLILEPQPWASYGKRKKLTESIYKNYSRISFRPEQFTTYLVSPEVGFSSYELIATPETRSKGFQRPVYAFYKSAPCAGTENPPASSAAPACGRGK
ncbi:7SK snRNA methylphosphate capping enzyme [Xenopus laevis]|uniref:RNA methyltransferase n=1 Tax=Xenopus laevis TaxID=8355 RepID=A0A8J0U3G1_XENLA|nr:7SK snRNA methylphosphate capping enzyme [Xenopus laevis]